MRFLPYVSQVLTEQSRIRYDKNDFDLPVVQIISSYLFENVNAHPVPIKTVPVILLNHFLNEYT